MNFQLWDHQVRAVQLLRETVAGGCNRVLVSSPTASGKTLLAAAIIERALAKKRRTTFVVSNIDLVDQTVEKFYAEGIRDIGVIQANHRMENWSCSVQIASIQTIRSRGKYPQTQIVIFDECHELHRSHKEWIGRRVESKDENGNPIVDESGIQVRGWEIVDPMWIKVPFIGLSATPYTKGLGRYFEKMIVVATTQELIDKGILSKFRVFATGHPDLRGVRTVAGDYHEGQLSSAMQKDGLTADIVKTWQERWGKDKTLVFGVDRAHAQALQARFHEAGYACGYQDCDTSRADRAALKRAFHNGDVKLVSNVSTLIQGVDWDIRCISLCRPTKSEILLKQLVGRGLRTAPGKDECVILDHSDTTMKLGFVTDIEHYELNDGKERVNLKTRERLPKPCPKCAMLRPLGSRGVCPSCGFEVTVVSGIVENEGHLREIKSGQARKSMGEKGKPIEYTMEEKRRFYAELKAYGIMHGRKDGWASHSYRDKFGVWPNSIRDVPPAVYPSMSITQWVRHRNIAYAKSKKGR